jgi:hypothetical protein
MDFDLVIIADEAELAEPVHKVAHAGAGGVPTISVNISWLT